MIKWIAGSHYSWLVSFFNCIFRKTSKSRIITRGFSYISNKTKVSWDKLFLDVFVYTMRNACFLITPRISIPYPFLGTNQRKMEGHLWVTAIQFAVPSWKPRPLNMKIHSLSQAWLYPVFQIRLSIVIATVMGGCALDHIICRVSLTEKSFVENMCD